MCDSPKVMEVSYMALLEGGYDKRRAKLVQNAVCADAMLLS